jgi:exosortase
MTAQNLRGTSSFWTYFWSALAIIAIPMLVSYFLNLWRLEHYRFFPFVFIAIGYLFVMRSDDEVRGPRGTYSWILVGISLVLFIGSMALSSPWLTMVGLFILGVAFFKSQSGERDATLVGLVVPMVMLIRIPLGIDQLLVIRLQGVTTRLSSLFLDVVGVIHSTEGNVLHLPNRELFVAEACSGIQSVFTLSFVACLMVTYFRRRTWLLPGYLLVAIVLAIFGNVLRVSSVAVGDVWLKLDLSDGLPHEILGYFSLGVSMGFLWSFDYLVRSLLHEIPGDRFGGFGNYNPLIGVYNRTAAEFFDEDRHDVIQKVSAKTSRIDELTRKPIIRVTGIILTSCLTVASAATALELTIPGIGRGGMFLSSERIVNPSPELFDDQLMNLELLSHERSRDGENPRLGKNADVWNVQLESIRGQIVLSQTYHGWHEFCLCYENNKWKLINREMLYDPEGASGVPIAFARFRNEQGHDGYLLYTGVFENGEVVDPPRQAGRLGLRFQSLSKDASEPMAMLQLWIPSNQSIPPQELLKVNEDFFLIRKVVSEMFREHSSAVDPQFLEGGSL